MLDGIDKLPLYFVSLFHGIITAYLVYLFTDLEISDTYFIVFVIFCCIVNIITVRLVICLFIAVFSRDTRENKIQSIRRYIAFDPDSVLTKPNVLYLLLCVLAGIASAFWISHAYQHDWAFNMARAVGWSKQSSRGILDEYFSIQCNGVRTKKVGSDCKIDEYMEIWWKGLSAVSVGYISQKPEGYRGKQYVQLSDACELVLYNGELRYPTGKVAYQPGTTAFIDVNDPNILAVQIVPSPNPCESANAR